MINSISKYKFTKLEQSLISELLHYSIGKKVETARIIKNGKDITDKTAGSKKVFIEDKKMIEKYKEDIHNFWIKFAHDTKSKYISTM